MTAQLSSAAALATLLLPIAVVPSAAAQAPPRDTTPAVLRELTVTATRGVTAVFRAAHAVTVVDSLRLRASLANGIPELLRDYPGLDLSGTGANQGRPLIRGQRGQRILLLEDGIRLNNSRRQQDFGELPALAGMEGIARVEVVRGPLSVLYGSDAIGGAINLITERPFYGGDAGFRGRLTYRYSSADGQQRPAGGVWGQLGSFGFGVTGSYRDANPYTAPAGRFGSLNLGEDTRVRDTGVQDAAASVEAGYALSGRHTVSARYSHYRADDAGFGFVENAALGTPEAPSVVIRYPEQRWDKLSLHYRGNGLGSALADRLELTGYWSGNRRDLTLDVFAPFGPGTPPGAGAHVETWNSTDIATLGYRVEAVKVLGRHVLTYGTDLFRDRSDNTDSSVTTIVGFGPPQTSVSDTANTPNASFRSFGLFAQGELGLTERLTAVLGVRWQHVEAKTRPTPRLSGPLASSTDAALVGAANLSYRVLDGLQLVASVGRAFRSPNLVERFFQGPTPEGAGYQVRNLDLRPETSLELDFGVKAAAGRFSAEGFLFRNTISDGIRAEPTGEQAGGFDVYRNVNIEKLRVSGVELAAEVVLPAGFRTAASYTHVSSRDAVNPGNPVGDSYSSKLTGRLGWRDHGGRLWGEYLLRHNGSRKDGALGAGPVGPVLPAFTVHSIQGGIRLFQVGRTRHELTVAVSNLTNRLYAEFPNVGFFRPEPGRSLALGWSTAF